MSRILAYALLAVLAGACSGAGSSATTSTVAVPKPSENESFGSYMTRCLAEFGIAATQMGDEAFFIPEGATQRNTQQRAVEACEEQAINAGILFVLDRNDPVALTDYYNALVEVYECLASHDLAGDPPPSLETFIDTRSAAWHPYDSIGRANRIEGDEVCPSDFFSHHNAWDYGIGDPGPAANP